MKGISIFSSIVLSEKRTENQLLMLFACFSRQMALILDVVNSYFRTRGTNSKLADFGKIIVND